MRPLSVLQIFSHTCGAPDQETFDQYDLGLIAKDAHFFAHTF